MSEYLLPKEAALALEELRRMKDSAPNEAVRMVIESICQKISAQPRQYEDLMNAGMPVREYYYTEIAHISSEYLESGQLHLYCGTLDEVGEYMLEMFDIAIDKLEEMNVFDCRKAIERKEEMRELIRARKLDITT